jgi:hypothetical protein
MEIDYAAAVTALQKRLARLQRKYVCGGWIPGLPSWLLRNPAAIVVIRMAGIDTFRRRSGLA